MYPSTQHVPSPLAQGVELRRPVSAAKLAAILQIEYRTIRSANHPQCTISAPRWRESAHPGEANWTIDAPRECLDGCHRVINAVAAELATRYRLERRSRRRESA